jgi:hypothetical protein
MGIKEFFRMGEDKEKKAASATESGPQLGSLAHYAEQIQKFPEAEWRLLQQALGVDHATLSEIDAYAGLGKMQYRVLDNGDVEIHGKSGRFLRYIDGAVDLHKLKTLGYTKSVSPVGPIRSEPVKGGYVPADYPDYQGRAHLVGRPRIDAEDRKRVPELSIERKGPQLRG